MPDKFIKDTIYVVIGILLLIFILIQPYNLFCRIKHSCQPINLSALSLHKNGQQKMLINFSANLNEEAQQLILLGPQKESLEILNGKNINNFYIAKNISNNNIVITNHFEITPKSADKYLERIECLCFKSQPLKAGEEILMPVKFRINPKIEQDSELKNLKEITISYSAHLDK